MEEDIFLCSTTRLVPQRMTYITCIKLVTLRLVNYSLLVYSGRFFLMNFKYLLDLVANEN